MRDPLLLLLLWVELVVVVGMLLMGRKRRGIRQGVETGGGWRGARCTLAEAHLLLVLIPRTNVECLLLLMVPVV